MVDTIAIIPARGGSKGIPRKNIRLLAGKPLLAYSIEHAQQTAAITRIVVSTDDAEIGAVAQQFGAEVVWRPVAISGDTASSESALGHTLDYLQASEDYLPNLVVFLQATSPLRQPDDLQKAIKLLMEKQADSLLSVGPVHGFVWRETAEGVTAFNYDYNQRPRRQEIAHADWLENGSFYIFKPWVLRQLNNRLGGKIVVYPMHALDCFQVDEPEDLVLIEKLLTIRQVARPPASAGQIRLLVLDFDGVMTDNRVLVDENGIEAVWSDRSDGWGIQRLKETGVEVMVLSTETNAVVVARCRKLKIDCVQTPGDKLMALTEQVEARGLAWSEVAYMGNDVNDLSCLRQVGLAVAVHDAYPEVRQAAHIILTRYGGRGAVRELCELLIEAQQKER